MERLIVKQHENRLQSAGALGCLRKLFLKLYITFIASLVPAQKKTACPGMAGMLIKLTIDNLFIYNVLLQ
jgi:hypothetical protein